MLVIVHGGAVAIALPLPLPIPVRLVLAVLTLASLYRGVHRHALRRARAAVVGFQMNGGDDGCLLRRRGTEVWEEGRLIDRWVHPWIALAVVRCDGRRTTDRVVIPADAVAPEAFRRLRVRLRLRTAEE